MGDLFKSPNLNGITKDPLSIDKVVQTITIQVNEQGSEAANTCKGKFLFFFIIYILRFFQKSLTFFFISAVFFVPESTFYEPITLRVDHPFYYFIEKSDVPFIQGHVYDPKV